MGEQSSFVQDLHVASYCYDSPGLKHERVVLFPDLTLHLASRDCGALGSPPVLKSHNQSKPDKNDPPPLEAAAAAAARLRGFGRTLTSHRFSTAVLRPSTIPAMSPLQGCDY